MYSDGTTAQVQEVVASNQVHDLALLRVSRTKREPLPLNFNTPRIASRLYAIGSPRGYEFSISDGLLSQVRDIDGYPQYQLTCPFSPGNSGGPVVNSDGEVIGLSSWSKAGAQNLNFAIPARYFASLCSELTPPTIPSARTPNVEPVPQADGDKARILSAAPIEPRPGSGDRKGFDELLRSLAGKTVHITVSTDVTNQSFQYLIPLDPLPASQGNTIPSPPSPAPSNDSRTDGPP